jgi:serine/threonine protein kinase
MEYFPLSLHQLLQQKKRKFSWLSLMEIHEIALRTAEGLNYLHELVPPVIHRDIKSRNVRCIYVDADLLKILVKLNEMGYPSRVALCDFGVSKQISESTMANTYLGTFRWVSYSVTISL